MAKLADLIPLQEKVKRDVINLKGVELPIDFNFLAMEKIAACYDTTEREGDFTEFEQDIQWLTNDKRALNRRSFKVMSALIYGMVEAGGTECTIDEIKARLDFDTETIDIFQTCFDVFQNKYFDGEDLKKSQQPQDHQKKKNPQKNQKKNYQKNKVKTIQNSRAK